MLTGQEQLQGAERYEWGKCRSAQPFKTAEREVAAANTHHSFLTIFMLCFCFFFSVLDNYHVNFTVFAFGK